MIAVCWAYAAVVLAGPVSLRDGGTIEHDRVRGFTPQGIELTTSFEPGSIDGRTLIPWGEVRSIEGGWGQADAYRAIADAVWRADIRLDRGDAAGAGAVLEPIAEAYLDEQGPTSGTIAGILTATRLLRGERAGAVRAWLAARSNGVSGESYWIDGQTGLCTALPPVFRPEEAAAVREMGAVAGDTPVDGLRALYLAAASASAGETAALPELTARQRSDAGLRLVLDMVRARLEPESASREAARDALGRRLRAGGPDWEIAWLRLGIGLSMMGEPDPQTRDAGASRLVTVVIDHQMTAPGLSELARDLLIGYFSETGRPQHAAAVRSMDRAALLGLAPWRDEHDDTQTQTGTPTPDEESP